MKRGRWPEKVELKSNTHYYSSVWNTFKKSRSAKIQCFLWGHSRSFPHIEILAGAAAAAGVCVCVCVCSHRYVTPAPPTENRTRSPPPTGFLSALQEHHTLMLLSQIQRGGLELCRLHMHMHAHTHTKGPQSVQLCALYSPSFPAVMCAQSRQHVSPSVTVTWPCGCVERHLCKFVPWRHVLLLLQRSR